jgi:anion-transporting  ArsA/GET3 family ATPase
MAIIEHARRLARKEYETVILDAPATGHGLALLTAPSVVAEVIHDGPVGHLGRKLAKVVVDPEMCGIVLVTAAEEMPAQEAIEFIETLDQRLSRAVELMVVNGLYPDEPGLFMDRKKINEKELRRLYDRFQGARVELPLLPLDRGPALVAALSKSMWGER